ncbi:hypothetical protein QQM79_10285 [Marinobacteraceae bacterium S3BR75-40.1]
MLTRLQALIILACLWTLLGSVAWAEPSLSEDRRQALRNALEESQNQQQIWFAGWTGFYGVSTLLNGYQASEADDREDRYDARVSAITSALGLGGLLLEHYRRPPGYDAAIGQLNQSGNTLLARHIAQRQAADQGWQRRIPGLVVNALAGLAIGVGDDRPDDGAKQFALGMLINEIRIRTRPTQVRAQWDDWTTVSLPVDDKSPLKIAVNWQVSAAGLTLMARF